MMDNLALRESRKDASSVVKTVTLLVNVHLLMPEVKTASSRVLDEAEEAEARHASTAIKKDTSQMTAQNQSRIVVRGARLAITAIKKVTLLENAQSPDKNVVTEATETMVVATKEEGSKMLTTVLAEVAVNKMLANPLAGPVAAEVVTTGAMIPKLVDSTTTMAEVSVHLNLPMLEVVAGAMTMLQLETVNQRLTTLKEEVVGATTILLQKAKMTLLAATMVRPVPAVAAEAGAMTPATSKLNLPMMEVAGDYQHHHQMFTFL